MLDVIMLNVVMLNVRKRFKILVETSGCNLKLIEF